ncbi:MULTISPECIES: hypothetical protein [unclassified Exiguobacterium]|uniref:hypothetical protein n=1 Tax=Exiguobacterium TaxID=33986 RepID=UPI000FE1B06B|nr:MULTISPECIES: hypothetical protein [unclassified Exiguobacterium]RHB46592.1 hypothetical protein DW881_14235 [Exiguobacterium sp. AM39-5BH]
MNLFPSITAFIVVAAITYPLYEGSTAIVVSLVVGLLTAIFVGLGKQQQVKQATNEQQKLVEATEQSTKAVAESLQTVQQQLTVAIEDLTTQTVQEQGKLVKVTTDSAETMKESLRAYQDQLSQTVADLAKQTNESLMDAWEKTQQQLLAENKEIKETTAKLVQELATLQQQQKQLADETASSLQQWLTEQKQVAQKTFTAVQTSHAALLQESAVANEKIEQLWRGHHEEQLMIRQAEQQAFNTMLAAVEAKEAAYSKHLQEQRDVFEVAQQQLKEALQQQAQLSHQDLLAAWKEIAEQQLAMRQQEHSHIMDTQKIVTSIIEANSEALSAKIIDGWNGTLQSLEDLRKLENEHSVAVLQTVEQANEKMRDTLDQQQQTFNTAQSFYEDTYEQIKEYTGQVNQHEEALAAQHQQLIDTQQSIKETIATTLQNTLIKYTDVLTASKETLALGIEELKDQRAVSEETFGEFLEAFLEGTEEQEKATKQMVEHLQTEVSNLLEDSSTQLERAITQISRSAEEQSKSLVEIMNGSKEVIMQNQEVLHSLQDQTEETKDTAKLLERAFKELTTLNKNDMEVLQRLMR